MLWGLLAIILTLIGVVGIHEAGHALLARCLRIKIQKISIGFGRALLHWQRQGACEWVLGMWPLGGYIQLCNSRTAPVPKEDESSCFDKKPISARILVLLAGPLANVLFSLVLFVFVFLIGLSYRIPHVELIQQNSVAARAGVAPGDRFLSVNGHITHSWREVSMEFILAWGKKDVPVLLTQSNHDLKNCSFDLTHVVFKGPVQSLLSSLGIQANQDAGRDVLRFDSFSTVLKHTLLLIGHEAYFLMVVLYDLLTGFIPLSVLIGPIGFFAASINSFMEGVSAFLFFIASFSLALGYINLLPLPGLDGGSILYCFIESIRKKPLSLAMELLLYRFMLIALFLILVQLIKNDLFRLLL